MVYGYRNLHHHQLEILQGAGFLNSIFGRITCKNLAVAGKGIAPRSYTGAEAKTMNLQTPS